MLLKSTLPHDADVRSTMIDYIRDHFGDVLGEHAALLDRDGGLDELAALLRDGKIGKQA